MSLPRDPSPRSRIDRARHPHPAVGPDIVCDVGLSENPLVGAWRLVSWETRADEGSIDYPLGRDAVGLLIYTDDGHMAVSISRPSRQLFAADDLLGGTSDEKARAVESYASYCGRYERHGDSVVHHVEMSLFPNWTGRDQERRVELDGDRLILETPPFPIKGTEQRAFLVWERVSMPTPRRQGVTPSLR